MFLQLLPLVFHFFCEFEHFLFVAGVGGFVGFGVTVFFVGVGFVVFFEVLNFDAESFYCFVFEANYLLHLDELLFLGLQLLALGYSDLAILEKVVDLSDLFFDLVFEAGVADRAECVEFYFGLFELPDVGVFGVVYFGLGVLAAVGGEGADSFCQVAVDYALFGISFRPGCLLLLHCLIMHAE